jgi:hypothetical protein
LVPFGQSNTDRRAAIRFPIEREIAYRLLFYHGHKKEGTGTSINISSNGILFTADQHLEPGTNIEVTVLLDDNRPLLLVAVGRVVRSEAGDAAVRIERHEFRTEAVASSERLRRKNS